MKKIEDYKVVEIIDLLKKICTLHDHCFASEYVECFFIMAWKKPIRE